MFFQLLPLLSILIFRFFGLFIVLPVISLLLASLPDASSLTIGLVIGAPYLFQVLFQPLFGRLSDRYGRKPLLILGLFIFLLGSLLCMIDSSIYFLIVGRFLQGIGAVGGILIALVADCVPEEKRTGAMALMGMGIFVSFVLALLLGPVVGGHYGLSALFGVTVIASLASLIISFVFVKSSAKLNYAYGDSPTKNEKGLKLSLVIVSASNFLEKFLMILTFALAPIILTQHMERSSLWIVYAPALVLALLSLAPASILSEKRGKSLVVLVVSIGLFFLCYGLLAISLDSVLLLGVALACFFAAFSIQEAILQSLVSKYAKAKTRGAVIGDFSAAGFAGSFVGALVGGLFHDYSLIESYRIELFGGLALCSIAWALSIKFLANPHRAKTIYVDKKSLDSKKLKSKLSQEGVLDWYENVNEGVLVVKYDKEILNEGFLDSKN